MKFRQLIFILSPLLLTSSLAGAAGAEEERLRGFAEHQNNRAKFNSARERAERAQLEEQERWEIQRARDAATYKAEKKNQQKAILDDGPEAQAEEKVKQAWRDELEKERKSYAATRKQQKAIDRKKENLPSEEEELNVVENRPRYDFKKRASASGKGSSSGGGSSYGGGSSGGGTSFPTPPPFDDFGGSDGYVPSVPDDFGDVPPPPPPPPPPFDGDPGFNSDFPPPPAPIFEGNDDF